MKKLIALGAAAALTLSGCTSTPAPTVTVTETKTASSNSSSSSSSNSSSSSSSSSTSKDDMFELMMLAVGTPSYMLEGELLESLQDVSKNTCGYIDDGMTADDITMMLFLILDGTSDQVVEDAFMAATVASVYSYCPEYEGFWD